jgi:DNA transformation protein and related proteins
MKISKLKNLGPKTEGWLSVIGISSSDQLKATPVDKIYYQLKDKGFPVTMNLVYAIEGALRGEHLMALTEDRKDELKTLILNSEYMRPEDCIKNLQTLMNIGNKMSVYLYEIGIKSPAQFKNMSMDEIWDRLVKAYPQMGKHSAYKMAVIGAHEDKPWNDVNLN